MKTIAARVSTLLLLCFTPGCDLEELLEPAPPEPPSADCIVTDLTTVDAEMGSFAKVIMTAENIGDEVARGVSCDVKLKTGNTIIERSTIVFGDLDPGESAVAEAWFSKISSHSQYERIEYTLTWF